MKPNYASKICIIPGDVAESDLGMSPEDTRIVTEEVGNLLFFMVMLKMLLVN